MCHPAYRYHASLPSFVSESASLEKYGSKTEKPEWTEDQIAAIRAVMKKLTSHRILNLNDAEDLVQDALLTMISKPTGMVLEKGLLAWGLGILRKKVGNYYRKAQRYYSLDETDAVRRRWILPASPETLLFREELQAIVHDVLSQLPASQRQAMELMVAGFNAGEIAKQLQPESYQNVVNRLYRGRKRLAQELAKHGYAPIDSAGMGKMKRSRGKRSRPGPELLKESK